MSEAAGLKTASKRKKVGLYSKTCLKQALKRRPKYVFNTGNRLIQVKSIAEGEHSAMPSTCYKLPSVFKTFVLFILSGRLKNVLLYIHSKIKYMY